jgi:hypothetical protein
LKVQTAAAVGFVAEDYAQQNDLKLATALYTLGMGLFGKALPGGTVQPLMDTLVSEFSDNPESDRAAAQTALEAIEELGTTWDAQRDLVAEATHEQAERARTWVLFTLRRWRLRLRHNARRYGNPPVGTNALTLCGLWDEGLIARLRGLPGKPTGPPLLAALFTSLIVADKWEATTAAGDWRYWKEEGQVKTSS